MRFVLVLLMLLAVSPARSQSAADIDSIETVIADQIAAFHHDDALAAFAFASPAIQTMFGTPGNFMAMVERGYPPVYRARDVRFGPLAVIDGQLTQKVELVGADGHAYLALYAMQQQPDGSWKINGCQLTKSDSLGA
jgi:ketosteroid isomerase-like protein